MSPMRLIRNPLAVIVFLGAALALGGASAASATTHAAQTEPKNLYLYVGNSNLVPQVRADPDLHRRQHRRRRTGQAASGAIRRSRGRSTLAGPGVLPRPPPACPGPASTGPRSYRT